MQVNSFKTSFRTCAILALNDLGVETAALPQGARCVSIIEPPEEEKSFLGCKELSLSAGFVRVGSIPMLALEIHSHPRSLYCLLDASDEATWKMLKGWRRSGVAYFHFSSETSSELIGIKVESTFGKEYEAKCKSQVAAQERRPGSGANVAFIEAAMVAAASGAMTQAYARYHAGAGADESEVGVAAAFPYHCYEASCRRVRQVLQGDSNSASAVPH